MGLAQPQPCLGPQTGGETRLRGDGHGDLWASAQRRSGLQVWQGAGAGAGGQLRWLERATWRTTKPRLGAGTMQLVWMFLGGNAAGFPSGGPSGNWRVICRVIYRMILHMGYITRGGCKCVMRYSKAYHFYHHQFWFIVFSLGFKLKLPTNGWSMEHHHF